MNRILHKNKQKYHVELKNKIAERISIFEQSEEKGKRNPLKTKQTNKQNRQNNHIRKLGKTKHQERKHHKMFKEIFQAHPVLIIMIKTDPYEGTLIYNSRILQTEHSVSFQKEKIDDFQRMR